MDQELVARAAELLDLCRTKEFKIAAVESCTGGLVAATLTEIAGSSDVFERGFVTYSNAAKETMVGVTPTTLARHGAVSRETAEAMAKGALTHAPGPPRGVDHRNRWTRRRCAGQTGRTRSFRRRVPQRTARRARAQIWRHRPHPCAPGLGVGSARRAGGACHNGNSVGRLKTALHAVTSKMMLSEGEGCSASVPATSHKPCRRGARRLWRNGGRRRRTSSP